jgi:hypothetical protein
MLRLGGSKCVGPLKLGRLRLGLRLSHLGQPEGSWAPSGLVTTGTGSLPLPGEAHVGISRVVFVLRHIYLALFVLSSYGMFLYYSYSILCRL